MRDPSQIDNLVNETVRISGGRLDVLVYNSGAIWWSSVANTPLKRFQLMQRVNPEGLYATIMAALPVFEKNGWKGRIVVVSPPIYSRFFRGKTAYAMGEFVGRGIGFWVVLTIHRQGRDECTHSWLGYGLGERGQVGYGYY